MVDWNSPQTILANSLTLVKLIHVVDGIYIWEYFTTLWFEWEVLVTKRRPWRSTMLIYIATRFTALAGVCTELVGFNLTHQYNCQAWLLSLYITVYPAFALNSLLILLRTIAIWERRVIISVALTAVWLTNVAFLIHGVTVAKGVWLPLQNACFVAESQKAKLNVLVSTATDLILLLAMIIGVLRLESDSSIWRMLYRHGIVWIVLATVGLVPPTVFLFLNLNEPMNLMFQTPALVIMTICATRLYRSLATFGNRATVFDSFLSSAPLASVQAHPRSIRLPRSSTGGTQSLSTTSGPIGTGASLEVEFPTSYGRYRAEDLELVNDRLKAINEEGEECGIDKAKRSF
ncbi:hypothetical protein H4582DRAFT_1089530 [Lactarius indigo]|nr:hypothetical protein H4582DRAFT_390098 [Lactarius indigo]KAI9432738.1 hypothetical protein H4582DRAFT_1089530 [Lactarius indigo]